MSTGDVSNRKMGGSANQGQTRSRVGDRYFFVDAGYDRRVYENPWHNYLRIIGTFIVYYIIMALFWLACLFVGIFEADIATYYCCAVFVVAVIVRLSSNTIDHSSTYHLRNSIHTLQKKGR